MQVGLEKQADRQQSLFPMVRQLDKQTGGRKKKGKSLPKRPVKESLKDPSHKKMKISKSRSKSVTPGSPPANLSDLTHV